MQFKDFHEFLIQKFIDDAPIAIRDEFLREYNNWISGFKSADWVKYANEYFNTKCDGNFK